MLPVGERRDHQPRAVSQVLVEVLEVGVTNVNHAVSLSIFPRVPKLRQPSKSVGADNLQSLHSLSMLDPKSSEATT